MTTNSNSRIPILPVGMPQDLPIALVVLCTIGSVCPKSLNIAIGPYIGIAAVAFHIFKVVRATVRRRIILTNMILLLYP